MPSVTQREAHVLADIRARGGGMATTVTEWANINSGSRNLAGLRQMREILAERLGPLADSVETRSPDPVTIMDDRGQDVPLMHGDNIFARKRPQVKRRILLTGHMDTVFAADHPFQHCCIREAGVVNGPGTADMKGGLLIMIEALSALETAGALDAIGWDVVINADEEVSSLGSASLIREAARKCRVGLTFEPSLTPDGVLAGARRGSGNFSACIRGRAAHAGRNPQDGRNAVVAVADFAVRLDSWARTDSEVSANVARMAGGGPNNVVPDLALLWWNMRPTNIGAQQRAERAIEIIRREVEAAHGVAIGITGHFHRPPKPMDESHRALFAFVQNVGRDLGLSLSSRPTGGVCDGNNVAAEGVAVIDTMGARGGAIHTAEEFLIMESLAERAGLAALSLMRLAEGQMDKELQW